MLKKGSVEWKIALALLKNCRTPIVDLAKQIGVTRQTIAAKIKLLEKNEIIKEYYTVIDSRALGVNILAITSILVDPSNIDNIIDQLMSKDEVWGINIVTGNYNIIFYSSHRNQAEFNAFLNAEIGNLESVVKLFTRIILQEYWKSNFFDDNKILGYA